MGGSVMKAVQAIGIEEKEEVRKPVLAGEVDPSPHSNVPVQVAGGAAAGLRLHGPARPDALQQV